MIASKERAAAISRARRAIKLLIEHDAPTQQDLGAARDRLNECYNLPEPTQVWDAVDRLEDTAARPTASPTSIRPASKEPAGRRCEQRERPRRHRQVWTRVVFTYAECLSRALGARQGRASSVRRDADLSPRPAGWSVEPSG